MPRQKIFSHPILDLYTEDIKGDLHLHITFRGPWTKTNLKKMFKGFEWFKRKFSREGHKAIFVSGPSDDIKLKKFHELFGFKDHKEFVNLITYERYRISKMEI